MVRPRPLVDSILRLIWSERRISRAEIARTTELSRSTVSEIVGGLLPTGLIAEVGPGKSSGGRRPIMLEFQDDACTILGVDLGAAHVTVVLTDLRGRVLAAEHRRHPVRTDPEGTRELVAELCDACVMTRRQSTLRLVGVGVAVPSPIDPKHPDRVSELVLPDWRGHSGLEGLRVRFGAPLLVDNDANLGALAEHWWGAGRGVDDFAYIKLATGIGSGHVVGGEIYRGATGVAGEIGHLAIDPHGGPCLCGLRGCLVTLVGAQAMVARARELLADQPDSALGRRDLDITAIEEAALGGDALALVLVREAAEYLGIALAGMLNLMNPARVILGGGLSRLGELLLEPVRETVRTRTLVSSLDASEIRTSELGPQAVALGASTLVLKTALDDSSLFPPPAARNGVR
ncbi:MAG: ROK family transcriptional regulator [Candidatus Eiseniibacteriota bacterium]|jgi:glucokinase-like ROK family protein